jgi:two-component system, cell cycle response regulator
MQILVADDDPTSRLLLRAIVTKLGHECLVAVEGSSAWDLLSSGGIDVLLTDWMMPGLDGPELCRRVRDEQSDSYVYIVLTTGLHHPEHILEGMSAGADDYLIKPVDSFAVQTRLVAAQRVTELHTKLAHTQAELEKANLELLEQSLTDELTGLGNRRRMEEDLARTHARAIRMGRTYGVALFDIDHFKFYNDHYGHIAGDETLRQVATCIDLVVRAGECAYRYGGEEFLLLMPDCEPTESIFVTGERIRQVLVEAAIPHAARPSGPSLVTLSGGVSCWTPGTPLSALDVIEQADEALFRAKSAGRNRIEAAQALEAQIGTVAAVGG